MYKKNYFNFKKWHQKYLLTNDFGNYIFLSSHDFKKLSLGKSISPMVYKKLIQGQFIYEVADDLFVKFHQDKLREYKSYLTEGTVLHIFVVDENCNYACQYCQAGILNQTQSCAMHAEVAQKAVDIALEAPSKYLTFEFQGGEPLLNFSTIQLIVNYSQKKNEAMQCKKDITYSLVSNLSLLTDEMVQFFVEKKITVCTSIDGNKELHTLNRPCSTVNSYDATVQGLKKLKEAGVPVSALLTTSRESLKQANQIVETYVNLGLDQIVVRPLTRLGKAAKLWDEIGYSAEEFVKFYQEILKKIIEINRKGYYLKEGMASILLEKILNADGGNYMELRSPCGGVFGQLAYHYDGEIYTCDEGRMLAQMGDKKFLLGDVFHHHFQDLMHHDISKKLCQASCLECSPICHDCVYMPYCGTCPVLNYAQNGKMELESKESFKCKIMQEMLDTLFHYIESDKMVLKIFQSWIR